MEGNSVEKCRILQFEKYKSERKGSLSVFENGVTLPFHVKRIYYLYDVPCGESRGSHGHKALEQVIIAASGSFSVTLDDGLEKKTFVLNRPDEGLYVSPGMWRDLDGFSSGAVCLVLASELYDEQDYIRDYQEFLKFKNAL